MNPPRRHKRIICLNFDLLVQRFFLIAGNNPPGIRSYYPMLLRLLPNSSSIHDFIRTDPD